MLKWYEVKTKVKDIAGVSVIDYNGMYDDLMTMMSKARQFVVDHGTAMRAQRIQVYMDFAAECYWFRNELYIRGYGS